ncbi:MAG: hypothetical protein KAY24_16445, partial [Candidatus Eisenbacteria sp.]|nr:hypothetical protein [Candidatus Eisenbacteria bacterium]
MKSLDRDIIELERYFRRLRGYLSECALPLARLVSISHFVLYLDESFDDSGYYLPEVAPLFRESLSMWDPDTRPDPAHVDLIRSAANVFVATGIMSEAILPNTPDSGPDSPPETSLREPSPTALFTQVFIPVVQEVLIPPGVRDFAEGVGIVVTLTVAPRTSSGSGGVILLRSESG